MTGSSSTAERLETISLRFQSGSCHTPTATLLQQPALVPQRLPQLQHLLLGARRLRAKLVACQTVATATPSLSQTIPAAICRKFFLHLSRAVRSHSVHSSLIF